MLNPLLRKISRFLKTYPAYRLEDVLIMDARWFFALAHEAEELEKEGVLNAITASAFPHLEKDVREDIIKRFSENETGGEIPNYIYQEEIDTEQFERMKAKFNRPI